LIIIINKNSPNNDEMFVNVDNTTHEFLRSVELSVKFIQYKERWKYRQRKIETAVELIQCYYNDFRVISLPLHCGMPSTASLVSRQMKQPFHHPKVDTTN